MKKALFVIVPVVLLIWMVTWFRAPETVATSAAQPWPGRMGTLDSALTRLPSLHANDASRKLKALVGGLPKTTTSYDYVGREIAKGDLTIGNPPLLADVSAIRELAMREPIVWESRDGIDDPETTVMRATSLRAARALVASALARARADDAAAWEDLHAAWTIARSMDAHPQMMARTAVLSIERTINAVAWKMPLPAPPWFGELQQRDYMRPLLEGYQYQTACYWRKGMRIFPTKWLASAIEHDRLIAEKLVSSTSCDVNGTSNEIGFDLTFVWRRAFRYRAEREATANALRVREGRAIDTHSACSGCAWTLDATTVQFSREIATAANERPMPLVLHVARSGT